jgi:mRNA-degrading endonuclease RelE of RelBE toxin-antitoxin system
MYEIEVTDECKALLGKLDGDVRRKISKKILQISNGLPGRHLQHGLDFFVEEVGQYRICYVSLENIKVRRIHFIGNHKEYERWINSQEAE